jgi:hypothetical protein
MSCLIIQDLLLLAKNEETELRKDPIMKDLKPIFKLLGSIPEATCITLANELDISIDFEGFSKDDPPFQVEDDDPFHLTLTKSAPEWLRNRYVMAGILVNKFDIIKFLYDLFRAVELSIAKVFEGKDKPFRLKIKTTNKEFISKTFNCEQCKDLNRERKDPRYKQCMNCMVAVSQSKIGICLQFIWTSDKGKEVYTSVDLIPTFGIIGKAPLQLARAVNLAMLNQKPEGWLDHLTKYFNADMVLTDLLDSKQTYRQNIKTVLMKNLNCSIDNNFFIQPG